MKYIERKQPVTEAITFNEFVEYGRAIPDVNIVDGMPWEFSYKGCLVTHENDECYLIDTTHGPVEFTPGDMLLTHPDGEIFPCKKEKFVKLYRKLDEKDEMVLWAERTAKKIDESAMFMQLFKPSDSGDLINEPDYILQIGFAIMMDKPIAVIAGYGDEIPKKLEEVADVIEFFDRGSMKSIGDASEKAIKKLQEIYDLD